MALSVGRPPDDGVFSKADAIECAKDINALGIPWEHVRTLGVGSEEYRSYIGKILEPRTDYDLDGLLRSNLPP